MTPWRSREYRRLSYVEGKTCIRCGRLGCEPCHYSGLYSDQLGKGGAQKSLDVTADLCRECHIYFDLYKGGNDDTRAAEFLLCIMKTLHRNLQLGLVLLVVTTEPKTLSDVATHSSPATMKKGKRSRCTAAANQVKRPASGFA